MNKIKSILRSINVLNCILITVIAVFALVFFVPQIYMKVTVPVSAPKTKASEKEEQPVSQSSAPSLMEYAVITEMNLFHPERQIPPEKKEVPPPPKPELLLYGTLISDEGTFAFMEDVKNPHTTPGRGKRQTAFKKGSVIGGFVLKEINETSVFLTRGEETMTVQLIDSAKPKTREVPAQTPGMKQPQSSPVPPHMQQKPQRPSTFPQPTMSPQPERAVPLPSTRPSPERKTGTTK